MASENYLFPVMPINRVALMQAHREAVAEGVGYSLGAKDPGSDTAEQLGTIDCSGYVGWLLHKATGGAVNWCGLGTWHLAQRLEEGDYKQSTVANGKLKDGCVRIAVMLAGEGVKVGHTALIYQGATLESHGGKGVNSRTWTGNGWQKNCRVWVLSPPTI